MDLTELKEALEPEDPQFLLELEGIFKSKTLWAQKREDLAIILEQLYRENTEFLDKKESYLCIAADLLETIISAQLEPSLYWEIARKFKGVDATERNFTMKLREQKQRSWDVVEKTTAEWLRLEPMLEYSKHSKMGEEERKEIIKLCHESEKIASEVKVTFDALKTEWDGMKGLINDDLDHCIQRMKELEEQVK